MAGSRLETCEQRQETIAVYKTGSAWDSELALYETRRLGRREDIKMIVTRWQASMLPTLEQIKMIFQAEGLAPTEEVLAPKVVIPDHRHPFDEVRVVMSGTLFMNISGNQILLRAGDRINIPANTRHSKSTEGEEPCVSIIAQRPF